MRQRAKASLEAAYRAMFAGPHGAALRHSDWLPLYIVEATIPRDRIQGTTRNTDLTLCTVLWEHVPTGFCGLSFFNNHLDANSSFSSFVVDGETTSRFNKWAVGEKGKGFVLATRYFFEKVEQTVGRSEQSKTLKQGVSFRVGHEIGELKWKKGKHDVDQLKVIKDDLTPTDLAGLMARRGLHDVDSSDGSSSSDKDESEQQSKTIIQSTMSAKAARSLKAVYKRRFKYKMSEKNMDISEASSPAHETSFVSTDEVSITILGLPRSSPFEVFSGFYGILPPEKAWSLPNSKVQFFKLRQINVKYQGDMETTSDRRAVITHGHQFDVYCRAVGEAADKAFRRSGSPELATQLALEILRQKTYATVSVTRFLHPPNGEAGGGYRAAFQRAWMGLKPSTLPNAVFWPFPANDLDDFKVIEELGMVGCAVSHRVMGILEKSGAYTRIRPHTKTLLLAAPELEDEVPGLERFRQDVRSAESGDGSESSSTVSSSPQRDASPSSDEDSSDRSFPPQDRSAASGSGPAKAAPESPQPSKPVSSVTSDSPDLMDKFTALSSHMREVGVLLQQQNDITKTERAQIGDLNAQLEDMRQKLQGKRKELKRERQAAAAAKAEFEREKEDLEDKLECTQQLLQGQWSARSEERKAKRRREE
ncbi:hypothetical protein FRC00_012526 [Tulasnella sp. 408]|nr:hypothetical protein FRC00_012526 [Tulasnella sp. 408]